MDAIKNLSFVFIYRTILYKTEVNCNIGFGLIFLL